MLHDCIVPEEIMTPVPRKRSILTVNDIAAEWASSRDVLESMLLTGPVTLVINDITRPVSGSMLVPVANMLEGHVRIIVATGTHRSVTEKEKNRLLCGFFPDEPWKCNDCDSNEQVEIGQTGFGTGVLMDPWVASGGPVLALNTVEAHYFAGFTGGRKSFLPGVSARKTILDNHFLACLPGSAVGVLSGNPVHMDMMEALRLLEERTFMLQANGIISEGELVHLSVGKSEMSFMRTVEASRDICGIQLPERPEKILVYPGSALEINLYQALKAIYHWEGEVADGGTILLVAECPEGLGAEQMEYILASLAAPGWKIPSDSSGYTFGDHSVMRLKKALERINIAVCSGLRDDIVSAFGFHPVHDLQSWIDRTVQGNTVFVENAGLLFPETG